MTPDRDMRAALWGLPGAFIGVPITIVVLAFAAEHPSTRWLADLAADGFAERPS